MSLEAFGRFDLRLTVEEFWRLTPAQFRELTRRWEAEQEARDWRAGVVAATVANVNRGRGQKAFKAEDFMPRRKASPKPERKSGNQMLAVVEQLNAALGGSDLRQR